MRRTIPLLLAVVVVIAGCGASTTPKQRITDASTALGAAHSVHIEATTTDAVPHYESGDISNTPDGAADVTFRHGPRFREVRIVDQVVYERANLAWWQSKAYTLGSGGNRIADALADRWVHVVGACACVRSTIDGLRPNALRDDFSLLSDAPFSDLGDRSYAGRHGETLSFSTHNPAGPDMVTFGDHDLPSMLRFDATVDSGPATETVALSRYDEPVTVVAPTGAIDSTPLIDHAIEADAAPLAAPPHV